MWLQLEDGRNVIIGWSEDESGCNYKMEGM